MTVAELLDDITYVKVNMWHLIQLYIQMKVYLNCPETVQGKPFPPEQDIETMWITLKMT